MIRVKESGLNTDVRKALNELARTVESLRVFTSDTIKVRRRTIGTTLEGTKKVKPGEPGEGMKFKGEYIPGQTYDKDDVVVVRGGSTAGTYVAYQDIPSTVAPNDPPVDPTQGIYWIQIAPGYTIGQWT